MGVNFHEKNMEFSPNLVPGIGFCEINCPGGRLFHKKN